MNEMRRENSPIQECSDLTTNTRNYVSDHEFHMGMIHDHRRRDMLREKLLKAVMTQIQVLYQLVDSESTST